MPDFPEIINTQPSSDDEPRSECFLFDDGALLQEEPVSMLRRSKRQKEKRQKDEEQRQQPLDAPVETKKSGRQRLNNRTRSTSVHAGESEPIEEEI